RNLPIRLLAGKPHFQIVGLRRGKSEITCTQLQPAKRKLEPLQYFFRVPGQRLQLRIRLLRRRQLDELHFVELVLPNLASDILSVRSGFASETRGVCGVTNRQVPAIENLAAMKVCERHFSRWDQIQIPVAGDFEQVGLEFRQLSSALECRGI